jgi:hypothetical protein
MQNMSKVLDTINKLRPLFITIAVAVAYVFTIWFSTKLFPIQKSINGLEFRVNAIERTHNRFGDDIGKIKDEITSVKEDTAYIRGVLENK